MSSSVLSVDVHEANTDPRADDEHGSQPAATAGHVVLITHAGSETRAALRRPRSRDVLHLVARDYTRLVATRRSRLPPEVRRQQIAEAAREVFVTRGLSGARTTDIAAAAGITETVLYRHFRSKEEVFEEAILLPIERLAGELLALESEFPSLTGDRQLQLSHETHQKLFKVIYEITPLLGVALFSDRETGTRFYNERLFPVFERVINGIRRAMPPQVLQVMDARNLFLMLCGLYLGRSFDAQQRDAEIHEELVAQVVTDLILFGAFPDVRR